MSQQKEQLGEGLQCALDGQKAVLLIEDGVRLGGGAGNSHQ